APPRDLHSFPTRRSSDLASSSRDEPQEFALSESLAMSLCARRAATSVFAMLRTLGAYPSPFPFTRKLLRHPPPHSPRRHDHCGRSEEHTSELQSRGHLVC